jgi:hypothetical protein
MATTTNYSWSTPDDTALVKDGAAAIRSLGTAIDTTVFNNAGAAIAKTIVDAKGDLIAATAADTVARLAYSGTNGDLLTVDTSTATGLKWVTPAASGAITLISETVASSLSSLTLGSIPSTYKQLLLIWSGITHSDNTSGFAIRLNNDSGANYPYLSMGVTNGTAATDSDDTTDLTGWTNGSVPFGYNVTANEPQYRKMPQGSILIDNYASTSKYKNVKSEFGFHDKTPNRYFWSMLATYESTSAISSIDIFRATGSGTFSNAANTSIRLYGLS